jgi:hypothetical protein
MSDGQVKQEFKSVGQESIVNALNQIAKGYDNLGDRVEKLYRATANGGERAKREHADFDMILARQISTVGGLATSWLSVQSVVQALNADYQRTIELQNQASEARGKLARGHAEIFLNTFGQSDQDKQKLLGAAQTISGKYNVPEADVAASLGRQAGRGVGLSLDQIIAAQDMATALGRHTPEQIEPLSTVIQQTMRATGKNVQWSAALAQSGAAAAFPGDPRLQSRFLQQALTGSLANISKPDAASAEQVFEVAAALSQAGGEERGEAGRTATISLLAQFDEFREGRGKWAYTSPYGGKPRNRPVAGAPSAPGDMIEWLRENPNHMKRFFDKASFEQHYEGIIRRMVMEPGSQVGKLYSDTRAAVGPDVRNLERQLVDLESGSSPISRSVFESRGRNTVEQRKARLNRADVTSNLDKDRDEALKLLRESWAGHYLPIERSFGLGANDALSWLTNSQAESRLGDIKNMREEVLQGSRIFKTTPDKLNPESREVYDALTKLIENGERQIAELKNLNGRQPSAGPAMNMQRGIHSER